MSIYSLLSSFLSYVFTTIIYLFIFCIIVLIYKDIKRSGSEKDEEKYEDEEYEEEDDEEEPEYTAIIKHIKSRASSGFGLKSKYRIGAGPIIVGRSEACDISIPDTYLSQMHFKITCVDGDWIIEDLKSKNGTFVNDIRVRKPALLKDGDIISFGDVQFEFHPEQ